MHVLKKHMFPPGEKKNRFVKADWIKCWCGLYHSNRVIPSKYFDKYNKCIKNIENKTCKKQDKYIYDKFRCRYNKYRYTYNCGIILRKQNQLFVVQSYHNFFGFPKGSINDVYEKFEDCAIREFYEETGHALDIQKYNPKKLIIKHTMRSITYTYIFYTIDVDESFTINTHPLDDMEITSYGWMNHTELKKMKLSNITTKAIKVLNI